MLAFVGYASANIPMQPIEGLVPYDGAAVGYELQLDGNEDWTEHSNITERGILEKRAFNPPGPPVAVSNPRDCGIFTMDCNDGWDACNNACFHQYCILDGDNQYYKDLGPKSYQNTQNYNIWNRVRSGQKINNGKLCRNLPLSQRFYDKHDDWTKMIGAQRELEPDEWPMAATMQPDFDEAEAAITPRNSLRCTEKEPNGKAGSQYANFRNAEGRWGAPKANSAKPLYVGNGPGKARHCTAPDKLQRGDRFQVRFDPNGLTPAEQKAKIPYCLAGRSCKNDGFQFHLSALNQVPRGTQANSNGNMGWPYDPSNMNQYALTDAEAVIWNKANPGQSPRLQPDSLKMYKVVVVRNGVGGREFDFSVSYYSGGKEVAIGDEHSNNVKNGEHLEIGSSLRLPQNLRVTRTGQGPTCKLTFQYGDASQDANRFFQWSTEDKGAATKHNPGQSPKDGRRSVFNDQGHYCEHTQTQLPKNPHPTHTWVCWFAGY